MITPFYIILGTFAAVIITYLVSVKINETRLQNAIRESMVPNQDFNFDEDIFNDKFESSVANLLTEESRKTPADGEIQESFIQNRTAS